jgi:DNA-binding response OmpR family regulator
MKPLHLAGDDSLEPDPVELLKAQGIAAVMISRRADMDAVHSGDLPDLALLGVSSMHDVDLKQCVRECARMKLPVVGVVPQARLAILDAALGLDDFVVTPLRPAELVARAKRVLASAQATEAPSSIRIGDLVIDPVGYEVSLKGRRVNLRFKEYQLLRLLATNPGRVYTRESLLSQVWGYDYFGGTRTVDVHVRRLRSKIEDADHRFIETIWNVGYRFKGTTPPSQ